MQSIRYNGKLGDFLTAYDVFQSKPMLNWSIFRTELAIMLYPESFDFSGDNSGF